MKILGIESSCDDTAVAVVEVDSAGSEVLSQAMYSQVAEHFDYGGVVPEIASRAHLERLPSLLEMALAEAKLKLDDVDAVVATVGPGLVGALLMGATFGRTIAMAKGKPFVGINHLEGHALVPLLCDSSLEFPFLLLLVSGGHCMLVKVAGLGEYETLGATRDDAAGECFDKTARLLGLNPPNGQAVEAAAVGGSSRFINFPTPKVEGLDFSFSGLKSAIAREVRLFETLDSEQVANYAAATQEAIGEHLAQKTGRALRETKLKRLVLAGGVAANKYIRERLGQVAEKNRVEIFVPPVSLCTDNAVMIAYAGGLRLLADKTDYDYSVRPRWSLDDGFQMTDDG